MSVPKKLYHVIVVGIPRMDNGQPVMKEDKITPEMDYIRVAITPKEFSKDGKEKRRKFVSCELPTNAVNKAQDPSNPGSMITIPSPDTKPYVLNIYEDQYPDAFRQIAAKLEANAHTPVAGDSTFRRTKIHDFNLYGSVEAYIIKKDANGNPIPFYMMDRDENGRPIRYSTKRRGRDGQIQEFNPTTIMGKIFLYGDECDNSEVFIEIARKKLLETAEEVKPESAQIGAGGTSVNSLHIDNEEDAPEGVAGAAATQQAADTKTT